MNCAFRVGAFACAMAVAATASAEFVFSNVTIAGSLSAGATFDISPLGITFNFPAAEVGDATDPIRSGNIVILYEVEAINGASFPFMGLSVQGEVQGSGMVFINELIEDMLNPGVFSAFNLIVNDNSQFPVEATIPIPNTTKIKVKKTFVLAAVDTNALDLARITSVDQLIPTPGATALVGAGLLLSAVRRRTR